MPPRISICVPNLNTRPFLPVRFDTILNQSFQDWELLVYDSHSSDGSWEYITQLAESEPRMRVWQGPRAGTPGSWSPCVREARGDFVYIATSDDTMAPDCLEKLAAALDSHPDCDLAHCPLRPIDESGRDVPERSRWWTKGSIFAQSSGPLLTHRHVRRAPLDGLLHLLGGSVYVSITQLLIRRSLFDRIGYFEPTWGSIGDFNWSMRAGLVANVVHEPATWGGWRVHSSQATAAVDMESAEHAHRIEEMIDHAIARCAVFLPPVVRRSLASRWVQEARELRALTAEIAGHRTASLLRRRAHLLCRMYTSRTAREYVAARLFGRSPADWVTRRLSRACGGSYLIPARSDLEQTAPRRPPLTSRN